MTESQVRGGPCLKFAIVSLLDSIRPLLVKRVEAIERAGRWADAFCDAVENDRPRPDRPDTSRSGTDNDPPGYDPDSIWQNAIRPLIEELRQYGETGWAQTLERLTGFTPDARDPECEQKALQETLVFLDTLRASIDPPPAANAGEGEDNDPGPGKPKRRRKAAGGKPRIQGAMEQKRMDVLRDWWQAHSAGVDQKTFCRDRKMDRRQLQNYVKWYGARQSRNTNPQ